MSATAEFVKDMTIISLQHSMSLDNVKQCKSHNYSGDYSNCGLPSLV